jgi:hypothetical protein
MTPAEAHDILQGMRHALETARADEEERMAAAQQDIAAAQLQVERAHAGMYNQFDDTTIAELTRSVANLEMQIAALHQRSTMTDDLFVGLIASLLDRIDRLESRLPEQTPTARA